MLMRSFPLVPLLALFAGCQQPASQSGSATIPQNTVPFGSARRSHPKGFVYDAGFSPDGRLLVTRYSWDYSGPGPLGLKCLVLWEVTTGKELWTLKETQLDAGPFAFLPDNKRLVVKVGDRLKLLDLHSAKVVRTLDWDAAQVSHMAVSVDGKRILLSTFDGRIQLLDLASAKLVRTLEGQVKSMFSLGFSPNGKFALAASVNAGSSNWAGPLLGLWDTESGKAIRTFDMAEGWGGPAAFTPDSRYAVVGKWEEAQQTTYLVRWDIHRGREAGRVEGAALLAMGWDSRIVVAPDGRHILGGSRTDKRLALWDLPAGKELWSVELDRDPVSVIALSPDAQLALSAAGGEGGDTNSHTSLRLWDGLSGERLRVLSGEGEWGHSGFLRGEKGPWFGGGGSAFPRPAGRPEAGPQAQPFGRPLRPGRGAVRRPTLHTAPQGGQFRLGVRRLDVLQPAGRTWHRPGVQPRVQRQLEPERQARPGPLLGPGYQASSYRVALHVAQHGEQVVVLRDGKGFEPALPDVAAAPVAAAVAVHVGGQQPLHPGTQVVVAAGPEDEVEVVGHQAKADQPHRDAGAGLAEEADEAVVVVGVVEDPGAAVAAVEGVVAVAAHRGSRGSGHGRIVAVGGRGGKRILADGGRTTAASAPCWASRAENGRCCLAAGAAAVATLNVPDCSPIAFAKSDA